MLKEAEKESTNLSQKPNNIFTLTKFMKKDGKDIEEEIYMRGTDRKILVKINIEKSNGGDHA